MADTGAPWNIPYVENADLVKDFPTDSLALANAIAAALDDASTAGGIGSNVVSTTKTDTFTTTSTSYTAITGLTATITPTSATSKVLVIASVHGAQQLGTNFAHVRLVRGATPLSVGDAALTRTQASGVLSVYDSNTATSTNIMYLDSPGVNTATTYGVEIVASNSGTVYINRSNDDANASTRPRLASSITVIEVAP